MALPLWLLVSVGGRHSQRLGPSPTLGSLGPSHHRRHKSWVSLRGPPCAHGVSDIPFGEVRDNFGYLMNTCTNLSWEWQRQFQMINHKNYNLNVNENFVTFFISKFNYILLEWFHFHNEIPINCLFTNWKCTYILDFRPWRWSALNMGFVVERPSRMHLFGSI